MIRSEKAYAIRKILVAVSFNEKTNYLLRSAQNLAREIGASIHLLHVVDEWHKSPLEFELTSIGPDFHEPYHRQAVEVAERRLERLKQMISEEINTSFSVVSGGAAPEISLAAKSIEADLVMIGVANIGGELADNRLVSTMDIINGSSHPIMVINEDTKFIAHWPRQRIMVADDLRDQGRACLNMAFHLARQLSSGADIIQVNVIEPDTLKSEVKNLKNSGQDVSPLVDAMVQERTHKLRENMLSIAGNEALLQGTYNNEVVFGRVSNELSQAANAFVSDIVIYGHHEVYHRSPIGIGHMPLKFMLQQRRCVVIMP